MKRFNVCSLNCTFSALLMLVATSGCGSGNPSTSTAGASLQNANSAPSGSRFLLSQEPEGALGVIKVLKVAQDQEPVVVVGRIGGGVDPWVPGLAAFLLLDHSITAGCNDVCPDGCSCSAHEYTDASTLIKFCDAAGKPLSVDTRELLGVKEKQIVVVEGQAKRDAAGTVSVIASGIYVRR